MGSKTIYVDEEVYALINQQVQGLGDTANRVVRRLIGLDVEPHGPRGTHGAYSSAVGAVLATLRDAHGDVTVAEVADMAGVGRSTAGAALVTLEQDGLARRIRGKRKGHQRPLLGQVVAHLPRQPLVR